MGFESGSVAKAPFNLEQAIVLGNSLASARRSSLDLSAAHCYREVGNEWILRLSRAMRNYELPICRPAHVDCLDRLSHCADLIELDQHRICCMLGNSALDELCIGDVDVVPDDLNPVTKLCGKCAKALPVVFAEPILY